jgi:hypothetical protein
MKTSNVLFGAVVLSTAFIYACGQSNGGGGAGGQTGGTNGTGGKLGTGGSPGGSGGSSGSGGASTASGGSTGSGGKTGSGGNTGSGGSSGSGGKAGSGGTGGGKAGSGGTGGTQATGGTGGTGGDKGTGGGAGSGGNTMGSGGTAGNKATGGTSGGGGAPTGGSTGSGGAAGSAGSTTGTGGAGGSAGNTSTGANTSVGGQPGTGGNTSVGGSTGGLPPLTVNGTELQANGKKVILRGSSLIDLGALYAYIGNNTLAGVTGQMDKIAAAGVQGHVVRIPVYPKIDYNGGYPYCSPVPYPVGTGPSSSCTVTAPMTADDYYTKLLKPTVDYATSKNLYVIIDHHQIDDVTTGTGSSATASTSAKDANTFWADIAPKFASYSNVLFEVFNEPIDTQQARTIKWAQLKPVVQGWIDTIRKSANNVIIVPSISYDQNPGDAASDPPTGGNLMYTAHIYPNNWNATFKTQVATAVSKAPVFVSEWGYIWQGTDSNQALLNTTDPIWGSSTASQSTSFRSTIDSNGASWTAWVTDYAWTPNMFTDSNMTSLTDFGNQVKTWLKDKATSDWVQ